MTDYFIGGILSGSPPISSHQFSSLDFGSWKGLFNRFAFGKVLTIYALLLLDIVSASFVSMVSRLYVWLGGKLPGSQLDGEIVLLTQCTKNKVSMNDIWVISLCLFIFMCLTHMSHLRCLQPEAFQVEAFGDREHTGTNQPRSRSATAQVERHLELRLTLRRPLVLEAIGNVAKTWVVFSCFSLQSLWDFPI